MFYTAIGRLLLVDLGDEEERFLSFASRLTCEALIEYCILSIILMGFLILPIRGGGEIDLFKEVWVDATFFWKVVGIVIKGILSAYKDRECGRSRRGISTNINCINNGRKEKKNLRQ